MSETFTKLFGSITDSTIWAEDNETRLMWITMLAMADQHGYVGASLPGLAHRARVPLEAAERAISKFLAPDPYSRSPEFEGRRIEADDRGWTILNYERFRNMRDEEVRKEYERKRKREQRSRRSPGQSRRVPKSPAVSAQAEAETDTEAKAEAEGREVQERGRALTTTNPHAKPTNLINGSDVRRHGSHAWCDFERGLCVPPSLHSDFQKRGMKSDAELREWYASVIAGLGSMPVGDDLFDFWRSAFAHWIGTVSVRPSSRRPTKNEEMLAAGNRVLARLERKGDK